MLNREMINYSGVQRFKDFFETFPKTLRHSSITNESTIFERGVNVKA